MTQRQTLQALLEETVLPEIEDYIDDLFELIASKKDTQEDRDELEETREVYREFQDLLSDVVNGDMDEDECREIIAEIHEMRSGQED